MEDFDISSSGESSESCGASPEAISEKSEKQKESYKKAQAQIQKSKKDEKKAKGDNDDLFSLLTRFISNPYYESLVPTVTDFLSLSLPSRPIIGILALIYPDAAHRVFHDIGEADRIHLMQALHRYDADWSFHERELHSSLRDWMSVWIESFDRYIVLQESSLIMQKKFFSMIDAPNPQLLNSITDVVFFFFISRNIIISRSTTEGYTQFILRNIRTTLQKSIISHPDGDIAVDTTLVDMNLFGL